jgi:hypothetical protein
MPISPRDQIGRPVLALDPLYRGPGDDDDGDEDDDE